MKKNWFEVDAAGLRQQLEGRRGIAALLLELLQNALDEDGVTTIEMVLTATPGKPEATFSVEDDSPNGFRDMSDAYTLFAPSYKKGEATKRGRFNVGEKLVLALCEEAVLTSTRGTVIFDRDGRRQTNAVRALGTKVVCRLRMTHADTAELDRLIGTVLIPPTCKARVTYNGAPLLARTPVAVLEGTLPTELAGADGVIRRSTRKTKVYVYEPRAGEAPTVYEMGLPVVEVEGKFHLDVGQKVPVNLERDNVPPSYLRALRVLTLNALHGKLEKDDFTAAWVADAVEDKRVEVAAVQSYLTAKHGADRVAVDVMDPDATRRAQAAGAVVVYGRSESPNVWEKAREGALIPPASARFGTKLESLDRAVSEDEWTVGIRNIAAYAKALAAAVLGLDLAVEVVDNPEASMSACYGHGHLKFNVGTLGASWFDRGPVVAVNDLLIHEFGHEFSGDHLSSAYYAALTNLGAKVVDLAIRRPEFFEPFWPA